uniref:Uncharacterized protein n=1 Tax=viral metagenome TaxID=1070528 RepID=A0A6M3JRA2_9ZZZZ
MEKKKIEMNPLAVQIRHYRLKELRELGSRTSVAITYIETFRDLSEDEKADIFEDYIKQTKGHAPKTNPFGS